ncbi:MAG: Ig-like domain-containing protein [Oscillospiraceae bacterium]|jgi:alpha-amylase|nr:Ig-like domain-containing protein [Oscillospiraceae bacterium]
MKTMKKLLCVFLSALLLFGVGTMGTITAGAASTAGYVPNPWWQNLSPGFQTFLYIFCFGWIWMKPLGIPVKGISFNGASAYTISVGKQEQLSWTITPDDAKNKNVTLTTSNSSVATVSSSGLVKAVGAGTAYITVKANDTSAGSFSDTVTVCVQGAASTPVYVTGFDIYLDSPSYGAIRVNETWRFTTGNFKGTGGQTPTNTSVTWSSSNLNIATVDANTGYVTGKYAGTVDITATANDANHYSKTVTIKVNW